MENKNFTKKVYIETMGCQMNKSDSERILGMLSHFGYEQTDDDKQADLLMVNTCSIRQLSADKAYSLVGVWGKRKSDEHQKELQGKPFKNIKIAFCGCVAQQDKEKLLKRFPYAVVAPLELWHLEADMLKYTDNTLGFGKKLIWQREE